MNKVKTLKKEHLKQDQLSNVSELIWVSDAE